jgi:predicted nucleotidyltransferase component of viral defense system
MLTQENLREFIDKFQTNERNIVREYIQHLFLSALYKFKEAERLLFKGGTALRFIFHSPRFSEDIDFTGQNIYHHREIDEIFLGTLLELEKTGVSISLKEAKATTGGYLGLIHYEIYGFVEDMKFEVSLRKEKKAGGELVSIISEFTTPYTLLYLPAKQLVSGKIEALLSRKKPRDYYDLYFMLRHEELNRSVNKEKLKIVLKNIDSERIDFKRELSVFLPVSHHLILRDFKNVLVKEIKRYL